MRPATARQMCSTCTWGDVTNAAAGEDPEGTFSAGTTPGLSILMENCDFAACPTNPNANTCEGKYTTLAQGIVASDCGAACTECKPLVDAARPRLPRNSLHAQKPQPRVTHAHAPRTLDPAHARPWSGRFRSLLGSLSRARDGA